MLKLLVRERNKIARECEYEDYFEFQLSSIGWNANELFGLLGKLDSITAEPYDLIIQKIRMSMKIDTVEPWDLAYSPNSEWFDSHFPKDSAMAILDRSMTSLGYPMDSLKIIFDLKPRGGKDQGAFCIAAHVPDDIRISANLEDGFCSYCVLFHEVGHALHESLIDQPYFIFRDSPSGCFSEAMATINEMILYQPEWLREYAAIPDSMIRSVIAGLKEEDIITLRRRLADVYFERELYRADGENANEIYWDMMSRFTSCGKHPDSDAWASNSQFVDHPANVQNYILADLIVAQTLGYLRKMNGTIIDNNATAEFMIDNYFRPGASKTWSDLIREATGETLNARYFIEYLLSR